jgi:hypothetical protein
MFAVHHTPPTLRDGLCDVSLISVGLLQPIRRLRTDGNACCRNRYLGRHASDRRCGVRPGSDCAGEKLTYWAVAVDVDLSSGQTQLCR